MKTWAESHPGAMLVWFAVLSGLCVVAEVADVHDRQWGWAVVNFIGFMYGSSRTSHWYRRT